jgi:hypothetical protein
VADVSEIEGKEYRLHEFLANRTDLLGQGGGEHHDLLVVWRRAEDILNISAHV